MPKDFIFHFGSFTGVFKRSKEEMESSNHTSHFKCHYILQFKSKCKDQNAIILLSNLKNLYNNKNRKKIF